MFSSFKQGKRNKGGRSSRWHAKLLDKWNKNPNCHWCGERTVIDGERGSVNQNPLAATLDHLYSNLDLRRLLNGGNITVVSCEKCNNKRSAAEVRKVYPNSYDRRNNKISILQLLKNDDNQTTRQ